MKETSSAGKKEFFLAIFVFFAIYIVCSYIAFAFSLSRLAGDGLSALFLAVYTFLVITRYSVVFTHTLEGYNLTISRRMGKNRYKDIDLKMSHITGIYDKNPRKRPVYKMKKTILPHKEDCYITFDNGTQKGTVVFLPSKEMKDKIEKTMKGTKK